jgi:hypothetical protein
LELTRRTSSFWSLCSRALNSQPDASEAIVSLKPFDSRRSRAAFAPASVVAKREVNEHGGTCCANGVALRGRCSRPTSIVVGEPLRWGAVLHDLGYGGPGSLGSASTIRQVLDTSMPSRSSMGLGVTWPRSLRYDAPLVPHPGIGPSGADNSAWAGAGATMSARCDGPDLCSWLRPGCARRSFRVASTAIPVSILTSHGCHTDPGTYVSLSAVCWFSHVRRFKQQAQKIFACLFQAIQHGRHWARQEARS